MSKNAYHKDHQKIIIQSMPCDQNKEQEEKNQSRHGKYSEAVPYTATDITETDRIQANKSDL